MGTSVSPWRKVLNVARQKKLNEKIVSLVTAAAKVGQCRLTLSNPR
jgi:hypothetical protein